VASAGTVQPAAHPLPSVVAGFKGLSRTQLADPDGLECTPLASLVELERGNQIAVRLDREVRLGILPVWFEQQAPMLSLALGVVAAVADG
jgi:hypothetical protein